MIDPDHVCIACNGPLTKVSDDSVFCTDPACVRYGLDTALGKDVEGNVVALRPGAEFG